VSFSWAKWLAIAALLAAPVGAFADSDHIIGVANVIDGDTIKIHDQRIRLHGIDAPESSQECHRRDGAAWGCGRQAALALRELIGQRPVTCVRQYADRYGRIVGVCSMGGNDINAWLVANGWAVAYRRYSSDYVGAETVARVSGLGIWSGEFVMPWEWRREKRSQIRVHTERRGELPAH